MMRLVKSGYAKSIGMSAACDDDGHVIQPERYREAFVLTAKGRKKYEAMQKRGRQLYRAQI
jgi:hypothetical protein